MSKFSETTQVVVIAHAHLYFAEEDAQAIKATFATSDKEKRRGTDRRQSLKECVERDKSGSGVRVRRSLIKRGIGAEHVVDESRL